MTLHCGLGLEVDEELVSCSWTHIVPGIVVIA